MRRLFIPACLYLVTWSGALGPAAPWSIEATAEPQAESESARRTNAADVSATNAKSSGPSGPAVPPPRAERKPQEAPRAEEAEGRAISVLPTPKPPRKPVVHRSRREICDTLAEAAQSNKLPVPFFIRLLFQESRFEASAVSHAGAQGIAQFMPKTAASVGLDNPFDPLQAIPAAARLLRELVNQFGNLGLAAAAYNAGPGRVNKWLKEKSGLPDETRGYVKTVTGQPAENWKGAKSGHGSDRLPQRAPCRDVSGLYAFNGAARIPLPPKPPSPRAKRAPEVRTAHAAEKTTPIPRKAVASKDAKAPHGKKTALQLAARRREKKTRR
jgi:hypothetical protein